MTLFSYVFLFLFAQVIYDHILKQKFPCSQHVA
jgi:hypothetical protein